MNNTKSPSCGLSLFPLSPSRISSDLQAVFIARIVINGCTCPLIVLLNILVMVAVKTKRELRTKSNIALVCLATTDLVVGLVVQPLQIASESFILRQKGNIFCTLFELSASFITKICGASLHHLLLISAERYLAIKHPFTHETLVTEVRVIIASCLAWAAAILLPVENVFLTSSLSAKLLAAIPLLFFPVMVYFNVAVYLEVRRNARQIAANQVSLEAKEKSLKNKKAFYTTVVVLLAIFLSYIPVNILIFILAGFKDTIPANVGQVVLYLVVLLPVLNSLFNPLIYIVRIRYFRIAFIELLTRKTTTQAEELERNIFGPRQIGVIAADEQQQEMDNPENEGHETLDNGHETTVRRQTQQEHEETAF